MSLTSYKDLSAIPGDNGIPYFGHFFPFITNAGKFWSERQKKYGDIFKYRTPLGSAVVLSGPTANRYLLIEAGKFTSNKEAWEQSLSDLFPNGLMLMDGEQHQYHRSIMNEAFKKDPMQGYLDGMPHIIQTQLLQLENKKRIHLFPFYKNLTLQLAGKVFFGLTPDTAPLQEINKAISDIVNAASALPYNLPFSKYRKGLNGRKYLVSYFQSIIQNKRDQPGQDLFSKLCHAKNEDGDQFTDQEIIDHLIFVLMASHDTTAITLTMMSYFLAKYPQWQSLVRQEASLIDTSLLIAVSDFRKLEITGRVMKEALRIHPPLTTVVRKLEKEIEFDGHHIPKDTVVSAVFQLTHHDERAWTFPEKFDPDRFNKERKEDQKCPYAYAPFGAGKHHCIGFAFAEMQVKLVITELLKKYSISVPDGYECPIRDVPLKAPKDNLPVFVNPIKT